MRRLIATVLAGVLSGCSPPLRSTIAMPVPPHDPSRTASAAPPAVPAAPGDREPTAANDSASAASDDVVISDDASDLDEELSRLEQAEVQGAGGIHILVRWHRLMGQTHVAADLTFTTPGGTLRFEPPTPAPDSETSSVDEAALDYPLMERILPAGPKRWVVLGWSSHGEGMQTQHAWLIEDRHGPQVLDSLAWTTDRSHGGFAVDPSAKQVRVGVPLPQMPGADGEPYMHQGGAWVLEHGKQQLDLEDVQRLPSSETHVMALRDYYDPPFQDEPSLLHWSGRFVWFSSGSRFVLETPPRITRPSTTRR